MHCMLQILVRRVMVRDHTHPDKMDCNVKCATTPSACRAKRRIFQLLPGHTQNTSVQTGSMAPLMAKDCACKSESCSATVFSSRFLQTTLQQTRSYNKATHARTQRVKRCVYQRFARNKNQVVSRFHLCNHRPERFFHAPLYSVAHNAVADLFAHAKACLHRYRLSFPFRRMSSVPQISRPVFRIHQHHQMITKRTARSVGKVEFFVLFERITAFQFFSNSRQMRTLATHAHFMR